MYKKLKVKLFITVFIFVTCYLSFSLFNMSGSVATGVATTASILVPQVILEELDFYELIE
jgi:hypothetical protein